MPLQKSIDLLLSFDPEHRTRGVKQTATRAKQGPQGVQELGLQRHQRMNVAGAAQPTGVGLAPHDTGGTAGGVQQHRIKRLAVPPRPNGAGVGRPKFGLALSLWPGQAQPLQVVVDPPQALRVGI